MNKRKIFIVTLFLLLLVSIFIYKQNQYTINKENTVIYIEKGSNLRDVSSKLKKNNIIKWEKYFELYTKLKGKEKIIKTGQYVIPPKIKLDELLEKLQNPDLEYVVITIPEGYNIHQIASKLEMNSLIDKNQFFSTLENLSTGKDIIKKDKILYPLEGYLFPDTYYIPIKAKEEKIIDIMFKRFNEIFSEEYKKRSEELDMSINDIITIASLIEKEAANDKERSRISGVIYNRLKKGMPLQIDASVIYGITKGKKNISRLTYKDLKIESDYNTYLHKGLPPGPIASPGEASIKAALYPEKHDYLYYVLGENGHIFSKTYKEHLKNINK
ncbi:endolytic transglycosylase MltG [Tepidibacter formicigenes]|uniref:Endolytic murein transglycosylase n=1 Tax=Tepidibacter formicigenes DSM 15518 TaxID=1123349 RepID=A0A1M6LJW2_9FIRM|nr:endolytic transglycosylase MltG [Tepidibacter formicigenes]SHJ71428.1 UPF0755 protein [Tepidibacter formicigenes DSM 15518]